MDGKVTRGIGLMLCGCAMVEKVWVVVQKVAPAVGGEVPQLSTRLSGDAHFRISQQYRRNA
jgi:hypothetical protein